MARPVRSIIRLFEKLLFEEQKEALKQLQAAHEHSRSAKRAELEQQLAALGDDAPKMPARARVLKKANGLAKEKANGAARKESLSSAL